MSPTSTANPHRDIGNGKSWTVFARENVKRLYIFYKRPSFLYARERLDFFFSFGTRRGEQPKSIEQKYNTILQHSVTNTYVHSERYLRGFMFLWHIFLLGTHVVLSPFTVSHRLLKRNKRKVI